MIVKLTADQMEAHADKAEAFHKRLGLPGKFSTATFCGQWRKLMDGQIGHVWAQTLDEHLAQSIGLVLHPDPFTGEKTAAVLFWYRDMDRPGRMGVRLFLEVMAWCRDNNVRWLIYSARLNYHWKTVNKFLLDVGFFPAEAGYVLEL